MTKTDAQRLIALETALTDMSHRLYGNGQPGEIERMASRLATLEQWSWKIAGGIAFALFLAEKVWK